MRNRRAGSNPAHGVEVSVCRWMDNLVVRLSGTQVPLKRDESSNLSHGVSVATNFRAVILKFGLRGRPATAIESFWDASVQIRLTASAVAEGGTGEKRGDPWTRGEPCRLHGACTLVRAYGFVEFESHQQRL